MKGTTVASAASIGNIPSNWSVVGTGDFNGDGMGDILWQDSSGNRLDLADERHDRVVVRTVIGNVPGHLVDRGHRRLQRRWQD